MKKIVLKLDLHDDKEKKKAMKTVSAIRGIDSIAMEMKEKKMTVTGSADPVVVVSRLRKFWPTSIVSVGPAKEEKKKEEANKGEKKEEAKKEEKKEAAKKEEKKEEAGKKDEKKKEETKKQEAAKQPGHEQMIADLVNVNAYSAYNPQMSTHYYVQSAEENPNSCTIL